MRKGRSSRRSRVSRPLLGVKSAPGEALSTEIGPSTPPRVVVGVPPSDPPPSSSSDEAPTKIEVEGVPRVPDVIGITPSAPPVTPPASDAPSDAPNAKTDDVKTDFAKTFVDAPKKVAASEENDDKTKTMVFGSSLKVDEPTPAEPVKKKFAQTLAFGSSLVEPPSSTPDTQASPAPATDEPARLDTTLKMDHAPISHPGRKIDEKPLEAKKVETKPIEVKKVEDQVAPAGPDIKAEKPTTDTGSSKKKKSGSSSGTDHHHDDVISEKFFSEGNLSRHQVADVTEHDALTIPDKAKRKSEPAVVQRRQRFVRYVTWAVGVAAVLCLAAVLRTTLSKPSPNASVKMVATAAAAPEPKAAESAASAAAIAAAPAPTGAETAPAASGDPSAAPGAASGDPSAAGSATPEEKKEEKKEELTGDPKEEKAKMRKLLETRKLDEAIEAGEKSVALDPTDGEAWLILGATYQEKGKLADARRCYTACIKEGKTGPRHECGKMLR